MSDFDRYIWLLKHTGCEYYVIIEGVHSRIRIHRDNLNNIHGTYQTNETVYITFDLAGNFKSFDIDTI